MCVQGSPRKKYVCGVARPTPSVDVCARLDEHSYYVQLLREEGRQYLGAREARSYCNVERSAPAPADVDVPGSAVEHRADGPLEAVANNQTIST